MKRPMAFDLDKRVLCFDGRILPEQDISLANRLEEGSLFVVRSLGGDVFTAVTLANLLRDRRAVVVAYDYCISACASYLAMASMKTFVVRDTVVAWHHPSNPNWCPSLVAPRDDGPKRLEKSPCPDASVETQEGGEYRRYLNGEFYSERVIDPLFEDPPESVIIRKMLRGMFEGTGRYPDVVWTWNPRYYASTIKTKIVYEAYPNSQAEFECHGTETSSPSRPLRSLTFLHLLILSDALHCGGVRINQPIARLFKAPFEKQAGADDIFVKLVARRQMARHFRGNLYRRSKQ